MHALVVAARAGIQQECTVVGGVLGLEVGALCAALGTRLALVPEHACQQQSVLLAHVQGRRQI